MRELQAKRARRRRLQSAAAIVVAVLAVAGLAAVAALARSGGSAAATTTTSAAGGATTSTTKKPGLTTTTTHLGAADGAGGTSTTGVPTPTTTAAPATTTTAPATITTKKPASGRTGKVVVIDPGHQGGNSAQLEPVGPGSSTTKAKVSHGTSGVVTGTPESELVLAVGLKLRDALEARGIKVVMTRTSQDVDISNIQRAQIANEASADLFVRVHADGADDQRRPRHPRPLSGLHRRLDRRHRRASPSGRPSWPRTP